MNHALDLWSWTGVVGRRAYLVAGLLLLCLKYGIDVFVSHLFGRPWHPLMYLSSRVSPLFDPSAPRLYLVALLAVSLPFLAAGLSLSARRLRDMGAHPFWAGLFLFPFVHFAFFFVLAVAPTRKPTDDDALPAAGPYRTAGGPGPRPPALLTRLIPPSDVGAFVFGLGLSLLTGLVCFVVTVQVDATLGGGLFVGVPFGMGFLMAFSTSYGGRIGLGKAIAYGFTPLAVALLILLALAWEGVACLVMAAPILLAMGALGSIAGFYASRPGLLRLGAAAVLIPPTLLGMDLHAPPAAEPFAVTSTVVVHAPPEVVWKSVVSFPPIDAPPEPIFAMVAMPIEARIDGHDPGATRRCVFTNGEFVEPIRVWDAPRELRFGVAKQPPHLDRYIDVHEGRFLLARNADGSTTLRGTTWYSLRVFPTTYWRAWTDTLLHAIHLRVLRHVARISERPELARAPTHAPSLPAWMMASNETCRCTRHAPNTRVLLGY